MSVVTVVGGGPSVSGVEWTEDKFPNVIVTNNAWQLVPWAKILVFGDSRWWNKWNNKTKVVKGFKGRVITDAGVEHPILEKRLRSADPKTLDNPDYLLSPDSGTKALCVAYHEGYKRIQLAGFDLCETEGRTHFHDEHLDTPRKGWSRLFSEAHKKVATHLKSKGVEVVRITKPGLESIPYVEI